MKLIKLILKIVLGIVALVLVAAIVFLIVVSDGSSPEYKPEGELTSLETVIGKSIYESLEEIASIEKSDRPTSDKNKISLDLSIKDLNDITTNIIRTNESINNPDYLKEGGTSSSLSSGGVKLDTVTFQDVDGKIGVKARGSAFGFYKTSITLSGTPSIKDNVLNLKLDGIKLGNKLPISAGFVTSIFDKFNIDFGNNKYFDTKNLTLTLDLEEQLKNFTSSSRFSDFLKGTTYSVSYQDKVVSLGLDMKEVFTDYPALPKASDSYTLDYSGFTPLGVTVTISEEDFNNLIKQELDKSSFNLEPMELGGYQYIFGLNDLIFDIDATPTNSCVLAEVSINHAKALLNAKVNVDKEIESGNVSKLIFSVDSFKLGNTLVPNENFFDKIEVSADALTQGHSDIIKVKDVLFDRVNAQVKITYSLI